MPKVIKITAHSINIINRNSNVSQSVVLHYSIGQYFMMSNNPNSIAYPWMIWTKDMLDRYYEFKEPENFNKFSKVKRIH